MIAALVISILSGALCGWRFWHFVYGPGEWRPYPGGDHLACYYTLIWLTISALALAFALWTL